MNILVPEVIYDELVERAKQTAPGSDPAAVPGRRTRAATVAGR